MRRFGPRGGEVTQIGTLPPSRKRRRASRMIMDAGGSARDRLAFNADPKPFRYSPEIFDDDVQVVGGGRHPVQARIDDAPANLDGVVVTEIVGGLENDPGRIQRLVRLRRIGSIAGALACAE